MAVPAVTDRTGPVKDLIGGLGESGFVVTVGPTPSQEKTDPQRVRCHTHRIVDGIVDMYILVVDHRRHSTTEVLDQPECRCGPGRVSVEMYGARPNALADPFEQWLVVSQPPEERLKQMRVGVDHPWHHCAARRVNDPVDPVEQLVERLPRPDRNDAGIDHMDPPRVMDREVIVHGHNGATRYDEITHRGPIQRRHQPRA